MNNLSNVDDAALLDLSFRSQVKLDSGCVDVAEISDVVLAIQDDNDELGIHQLFVVRNLVMVWLTFSNFENSSVSLEGELYIFKLLGIGSLELQSQGFLRDLVSSKDHRSSVENNWTIHIISWNFFKLKIQ